MNFGKPNYDGGSLGGNKSEGEKVVYYKLGHKDKDGKDRNLFARIAPPNRSLAEKGVWRRYVKLHFGYGINVTSKKGEQFFLNQPFLCVEEQDRDGNITKHCAECDEVRLQKKKLEEREDELKVSLKAEGKSESEIAELVAAATKHKREWLRVHNLDRKWYMLAKDQTNKWGVLQISHSCMKGLIELFKELTEKGLDPLGAEKGIWLHFKRAGTQFNDIKDSVSCLMEELSDGSMRRKFDSLLEADAAQIEALPELTEFGRVLSPESIKEMVESGGEESVVRAVMNLPLPTGKTDQTQTVNVKKPSDVPVNVSTLVAAEKPKNGAVPATIKTQMDMPLDEFLKQFEVK